MNENIDLKLNSYGYELPEHLVAERPIEGRDTSRMLVYDAKSGEMQHDHFHNIDKYLPSDSLIVRNESKVFPCRLNGQKQSGGKVEAFFLDVTPNAENLYRVLIKSNGKKRVGDKYYFQNGLEIEVHSQSGTTFFVAINIDDLEGYLNVNASIPIPPYIRQGQADEKDKNDYQTTFAKNIGSVAAPTAGLHFTKRIEDKLIAEKNITIANVTLHVGMGTFAPVKSENILEHDMHTEHYLIEKENFNKIQRAKFITAVGTTSLRTLESVHRLGDQFIADSLHATDIFLYPGVEVKSINSLLTNFHLPESTLLMLVSALVGRKKTLELYEEAIKENYRFFSYGDCMLILR